MRPGRYCIRLSRVFTSAVSSPMLCPANDGSYGPARLRMSSSLLLSGLASANSQLTARAMG
jgi:hypothetical protein